MSEIIVRENVNLGNFNTYKTGGNSRYLISPKNDTELLLAIDYAKRRKLQYQIIGAGSNMLISDCGYDGVAIVLNEYNIFMAIEGNVITVGAGVPLNSLIGYAIDKGYGGLELLSGIPGLIGGGVKMNAGAYGIEFKDFTISADIISDGVFCSLSNNDIGFSYRNAVKIDDSSIISSIKVKVYKDDKRALSSKRSEILKRRSDKQPLHKPSCGSVFKRPDKGYAGEYIEKVGLKGYRFNGAMISDKHANFILNYDNAKSSDIKYLIDLVVNKVYEEFGVILEREVKLVGEFK